MHGMPVALESPVVAFVVTRLNIGGVVPRLKALATHMNLPAVVLCGTVEANEGSLDRDMRESGITVVEVPGLRRRISPVDDVRALWHLYRYFRVHRPQLVSTHTSKAGVLGRIAAVLAGVPVRVHTFHGLVLEGYFGPIASAMARWVERRLASISTAIIAVGPQVDTDLHRFGIGDGRRIVIRGGFDFDRLSGGSPSAVRDELGISARAPVIGIVGRLASVKNVRMFLQAATRVLRAQTDARFLLVGDGELRAELESYAAALGLGASAMFTGWRRDLNDVYAAVDVAVCCSFHEGVPAALIEACAASRPVVGTDVGGIPDVVEDGINGYVVPSGDADALAAAILKVLECPDRGRRMGREGRVLVRRKCGVDRLVVEEEGLYRRLLRERQEVGVLG